MAENFRDNEARERFELDVEEHTAFVTYRKSSSAITLVHTEVPPELGGKGVGSKLARATLDAVRAQARKLTVECDFIRNFMSKHAEYNDLLAPGQAEDTNAATYTAGRFCGAVEVEATGCPVFAGYCHCRGLPGLVSRAGQCLQPVEVRRRACHQRRVRHWHLQQDRELLPQVLQGLRRPCHDRASAHAADRCVCQSAAGIHAPADAACELREQDAVGERRVAKISPTSPQTSAAPGRNCRIEAVGRRVGKGAKRRAHHPSPIPHEMVGTLRFAHPHMRPFKSSVPTGAWMLFFAFGVAAARGAMRSAACRRGRCAQGLASGDLCSSSLHHLISGRSGYSPVPTFRMLAARKPRG